MKFISYFRLWAWHDYYCRHAQAEGDRRIFGEKISKENQGVIAGKRMN